MANLNKKILIIAMAFVMLFVSVFTLSGCEPGIDDKEEDKVNLTSEEIELLKDEAKLSFRSMYVEAQTTSGHAAYGMIYDRYPGNPDMMSIATVGFFLAAIPGAISEGWINESQAKTRVEGTLDTILNLKNYSGFYHHFINRNTANGMGEVSGIDTALMVAGVITAGEYFGGEIKTKAYQIYDRIDWNFYTHNVGSKVRYAMSYKESVGFEGEWDKYGEQLIMYVLGAGATNENYRIPKRAFYDFDREKGSFGDNEEFIYSWNGSIFTHQFSHAFVDFRGIVDEEGVDWYQNSVAATKTSRAFSIARKDDYKSYGENSWGLTACDTPTGYNGALGCLPAGKNKNGNEYTLSQMSEGTIAPGGALGSTPFAPKQVAAALKHYNSFAGLRGKYGLKDSYNISAKGTEWYASDIIGIDKGISATMILNTLSEESVWKYFMQSQNIQDALDYLGFSEKTAEVKSA